MEIIQELRNFILEQQLFKPNERILLAVSGGKDSMLMAYLFHKIAQPCVLAHCNFHLRGEESDLDEALVRKMGEEWGIPVFVQHFNTKEYAHEHGISIQMAARDLRYQWFADLRQAENCAKIAIAQHKNDHIETVLLNLTRGTGIRGLLGIKIKRQDIIRPILFLDADQIRQAVQHYQVPYRDDQSNFSTKYARNKIRHEIIPKFKEIQPEFETVMQQNISRFEEVENFVERQIHSLRQQLFLPESSGTYRISKESLQRYFSDRFVLYELFRPFGFSSVTVEAIPGACNNPNGASFASFTHELLVDRQELILREKTKHKGLSLTINNPEENFSWSKGSIEIQEHTEAMNHAKDKLSEQVDADKLVYPLVLRNWENGDRFMPLGMSGSKKLSDFFIQQKLNRFEKQEVPILVNGNQEIIWVVGMRLDNRFKVTENTKKVITFVYNKIE